MSTPANHLLPRLPLIVPLACLTEPSLDDCFAFLSSGFFCSPQKCAMQRRGAAAARRESFLTRAVGAVFAFVRLAEFEILFFLFFFIAFLIFKDLTSRPEYNQIFVKKPGAEDFWPF